MYRDIKNTSELYIYKVIIPIPDVVTIKIQDHCIFITGTLGTLSRILHKSVIVQLNDNKNILIYTKNSVTKNKALIGTTRALINGMIIGVTIGFIKKLQLIGIGYRVAIKDHIVNLMIGLSHAIDYVLPVEIAATCPNPTEIVLTGINKQLVGQVAADLRALRPPEPFKGKGIRYIDEVVCIKDSKKR